MGPQSLPAITACASQDLRGFARSQSPGRCPSRGVGLVAFRESSRHWRGDEVLRGGPERMPHSRSWSDSVPFFWAVTYTQTTTSGSLTKKGMSDAILTEALTILNCGAQLVVRFYPVRCWVLCVCGGEWLVLHHSKFDG